MPNVNEILDKVDGNLMDLLNANNNFNEYKRLTSTTISEKEVSLSGSIGLEIMPRRVLGISFYQRG